MSFDLKSNTEVQSRLRLSAVRGLTQVLSDRVPLDVALNEIFAEWSGARERAWLTEVCSGALRWKGRLEQAIDSAALRKKPSGWLRKILLISTYQILVQERVAPALVVSETVEVIKTREGLAPSRFANACLRKIAGHAIEWRDLEFPAQGSPEEKASWASLPVWFWKLLVRDHGESWACEFARASLERPQQWIRVREGAASPESSEKGPVPRSLKQNQGGAVFEQEGYEQGTWIVQDVSSQKLVSEVSAYLRANGGTSVLDLCAAPGGKSIALSWEGFRVSSFDSNSKRLLILRENLNRTKAQIEILNEDDLKSQTCYDLVWVDAPCSGTGVIRRHPDIRWLRKESEIQDLVKVQENLIEQGYAKVTKGGFLVYSVCSVLKDEGKEVFLRARSKWKKTPELICEWFLSPLEPPFGDGFWAVLVRKS